MLDLNYIRENISAVEQNIKDRFMSADAKGVVKLYEQRNAAISRIDELRSRRNANAKSMKAKLSDDERNALIEEGRGLKESIAEDEDKLALIEEQLRAKAMAIPNMAHPEAPRGKEEKNNSEIRRVGNVPDFSFRVRDHVELSDILDIVDFETAAKVSGPKFYYLKNEGVFLALALTRFAMEKLHKKGFTPYITPDIAKTQILEGIGFNPRGSESNIYSLEGEDTCLVGTAEITLGACFADQILPAQNLPLRMAGLSHCFRKEAGAAGQYSKGLYRVHQFTKVEMFIFCRPEDSEAHHQELLSIEEEIFSDLEIPYRVVDTCTGDLGAPAFRKFDLEAWMPGRGESGDWGEITSTSNCTDFQARRLAIRYKDADGKRGFVHMLNGTAVAVSRTMVSILENFQQDDGCVLIPKKLIPYTGFDKIEPKKK